MTLDERIEALTHTVELLAQMHLDNERKFEERFAKFEERFGKYDERLAKVVDVVERLAAIAQSHEHRLNNLENPGS